MLNLTRTVLIISTSLLFACGKPFPIDDALYAEYKAIVCKVPIGQVTPDILARQLEINKIFDDSLMLNGSPNADWIAEHSLKLSEAMNLENCSTAGQATIQPAGNVVETGARVSNASPLEKFNSVWHFNPDKTLAANESDDENTMAGVKGIVMGLEIVNANSAGMKIQNGHVQDGDSYCTLEESSIQADGSVSCVNQQDRTIVGIFSISPVGDLIVKVSGFNQIFEKK
jgi:hypothetical protein